MTSPAHGRAAADAQLQLAQAKLERLRAIDPLLIDNSVREPCFAAAIGHTLQNKLDLLRLIDDFGMRDKIIATLDYQFERYAEVEDDFCLHLQRHGYDMRRCFALTAVGKTAAGAFEADLSMRKLVDYGIPNTLLEQMLLPKKDPAQVLADLAASVAWLRRHLAPVDGAPGRIYLNIVDLMDAFMADRDWACAVLELLATLPVDGVSFEDDRGTYFPFQVGAVTAAIKALLRPDQQVLLHVHTGNGMENASVIEALLQGADGYWAGIDRTSATSGHASLGDLVANLVRAGNPHMHQRFQLERLLPTYRHMHAINTETPMPDDWPISGAHAYCQVLSDFEQRQGRAMDLPPEVIGGRYRYRIAPVGSDIPVVRARVLEALELDISDEVAQKMILLMRADLRNNLRITYDEPARLRELVQRAQTV